MQQGKGGDLACGGEEQQPAALHIGVQGRREGGDAVRVRGKSSGSAAGVSVVR